MPHTVCDLRDGKEKEVKFRVVTVNRASRVTRASRPQ